jgi:hypothetical protein
LEGSIKKWKKIVAGKGVDDGSDNCPLCFLFAEGDCEGCPVAEGPGGCGCEESPYHYWADHQDTEHESDFPRKVLCPECKRLAKAELNFLISLRERSK